MHIKQDLHCIIPSTDPLDLSHIKDCSSSWPFSVALDTSSLFPLLVLLYGAVCFARAFPFCFGISGRVNSNWWTYTAPTHKKIKLWAKTDFYSLSKEMASAGRDFLSRHTIDSSIQLLWEKFKLMCTDCINKIPHKLSSSRFNQPLVTTLTKRIIRRKKRLHNRACVTGASAGWAKYYAVKKPI